MGGRARAEGKKFKHFAWFEVEFERKALRATGHLHGPLLPQTIKANRKHGMTHAAVVRLIFILRECSGPASNN